MASRTSPNQRTAVADALHSAAIHLLRGVRKEDERTGVGPARLSALSVLVFAGPMRLTELARVEQVKPPTMTKVVAGLEAAGLVRRRADAEDARAVRLEATARGAKLLQEGRRRRVERLASALQALAFDELDLLARAAAIVERVSATI
ncbi:MAG: MarR family transcriptional regulator [Luteitalea sp.]|nr:MarR family transcriptional regulator [Luteitalea sp.]